MTHDCYSSSRENLEAVRWRSWLSHLSNTQKVPGSNPGRTIFFFAPHTDSPREFFLCLRVLILKIRSSKRVNMGEINTSAVYPATVQRATTMREERKTKSDRVAQASGEFSILLVYAIPLHPRNTKYRDSMNNATATITEEPGRRRREKMPQIDRVSTELNNE